MDKTRDENGPPNTETVRTMSGKIVVTIKTDSATGVQRGYDNLGNYVGKYDPRTKLTYSKGGKEVSKGNGLVGVAINGLCPKGMGAVCHPVAVISSSYRPRKLFRPIPVNPSSQHRAPTRPIPTTPSSCHPHWPRRR
jgi:hypothetical protein